MVPVEEGQGGVRRVVSMDHRLGITGGSRGEGDACEIVTVGTAPSELGLGQRRLVVRGKELPEIEQIRGDVVPDDEDVLELRQPRTSSTSLLRKSAWN